ncbi:bifunctional D-glycero-beta-D-manno-heptose-7-phosphate kinase/D-glycero-beta-D-manno-heptose 1-phosphate adenylyltransferase HldE [Thiorhodovibrio frisius]|uniref:Bifunctional protein HldE n=1 Tax=Thiorhodovibrio frisius TaxID=631362 RepID=H8Z175_9GAMM|nr:bifunctional D-glycero-beta-D-manno-heptose-7-phosphate kinase/D-glycero-beta-D-manno-heptose 1-phosphate adenylyltransferase HldE [Thiorhodovibrio frisius]EIC21390.1 D-heptose-7- phosphate 1-kinase,D-heptose-1-phosphate adenylyltransferase [Thiorhodovibrio frisius]WPL23976.1 Bifunctional protein HldE [Thiorhodovibrio frisius]
MSFSDPAAVREAVTSGFGGRRLLVAGDLMLDRYLWGEVQRISPEAPVPVLRLRRETEVAGGAANVARNLAALGLKVELAGVIGQDTEAERLLALLRQAGIGTDAVVGASERGTSTKTRAIGNHQQMLRIDREETRPLEPALEDALFAAISPRLKDVHSLLLSDYAKGVLSGGLCQRLIQAARALGKPVWVDPKGRDFSRYQGASLMTPNRAELAVALGLSASELPSLLTGADRLRETLELEALVITLGELGMTLIDAQGQHQIPAVAREVFDVSGAGDTAIAVLAAALTAGLTRADAVALANLGAGVVVGRVGTAQLEAAELLAAMEQDSANAQQAKILTREALLERLRHWRDQGERVVFTNGCFDLLHAGHVSYLAQARQYGQRLILGLNSDDSVRALKGPQRPIVSEADRALVLAGLTAVDAVVIFNESTPLELIRAIRPDVLVKGADYRPEQVVGADEVQGYGGQLVLIPLLPERSTSAMIAELAAGDCRKQG